MVLISETSSVGNAARESIRALKGRRDNLDITSASPKSHSAAVLIVRGIMLERVRVRQVKMSGEDYD